MNELYLYLTNKKTSKKLSHVLYSKKMSDLRIEDKNQLVLMKNVANLFQNQIGYEFRKKVSRCELPKKFHDSRLLRIIFLDIIWATICWIGVAAKLFNDDPGQYVEHYTNWGWTMNALYYSFDLIFILLPTRTWEFRLLFIFFWQLTFNVWMIFVLVFPMLLSNPGTITDNFKENGGDFDPGVVFVGDRIFHVVPVVVWFLYYYWRQIDYIAIYNLMYLKPWIDRLKHPYDWRNYGLLWYLVALTFFNTTFFWVYYNAFDFEMIYQVATPIWIGFLILIGIDLLIIISIVWLSPIYPHPQVDTSTWSMSSYQIAEVDRIEYEADFVKKK